RDAESLQVFLQAFTDAPMGVALIDHQGHVVIANPRISEMLESDDELVGTDIFDLLRLADDSSPLSRDATGPQVATVRLTSGPSPIWARVTVQGRTAVEG